MQGERATPRDLECLFDETAHLEQAGIILRETADDIRKRIASIARGKPELAQYFQLIADTNRQVVDLTDNQRKSQWLEDAYEDLKNAKILGDGECLNIRYKLFPRTHATVDSSILVSDLGFSVRTSNCLEEAGIESINDLLKRTEEELLQVRNFGKTCLTEVQEALWDRFKVKLAVQE